MERLVQALGVGWTIAVKEEKYDIVVAPEVKSQLEDARPKTSGLITHAGNQFKSHLSTLSSAGSKKENSEVRSMVQNSRTTKKDIMDTYEGKRQAEERKFVVIKEKGAREITEVHSSDHGPEYKDGKVLRISDTLKEAKAVRDAELVVLRAQEKETLQQKTAEIARKNHNTKARKLVIEQAARVQIEREEAHHALAQKKKEAQRVVDGGNGAPREGEDGGEGAGEEAEAAGAEVADAEAAAAEEEAVASAQLSAGITDCHDGVM